MNGVLDAATVFSAEQAARLTGQSQAQLAYWWRSGYFQSLRSSDDRSSRHSRTYSLADIVGLRTLGILKGRHGVSPAQLREVASGLSAKAGLPMSETSLIISDRKVQFVDPSAGPAQRFADGQGVILRIAEIWGDVVRETERLKNRDSSQIGKFERHRNVAHNSLVVAGTRVPVAAILRFVEDGYTTAQILAEYPTLTGVDVEAAIHFSRAGMAA